MATPKDEIMARSGPEDRLRAFPSKRNTSPEFTAGPDWGVFVDTALPTAALHYKDEGDMKRLHELLATEGPSGRILRDTATSRYICSKQSYSYSTCFNNRYAHQRKACTPADLEYQKCGIKLTRAVDTLCRKPFFDFSLCLDKNKADVSKCMKERTSYDVCVEDF